MEIQHLARANILLTYYKKGGGVTVLSNWLTPCRTNAFHCTRNQRLILLHLSHCKQGRHRAAQRTESQSAGEITAGLQLTCLGHIRLLARGKHPYLLSAARHTWILSLVAQSATSQCVGMSRPSERTLVFLYSLGSALRFERSRSAFVPER